MCSQATTAAAAAHMKLHRQQTSATSEYKISNRLLFSVQQYIDIRQTDIQQQLQIKQISITQCKERCEQNKPDGFWHHSVLAMGTDSLAGHFALVFYNINRKQKYCKMSMYNIAVQHSSSYQIPHAESSNMLHNITTRLTAVVMCKHA